LGSLLRWSIKFSIMGVLYVGFTTGSLKLPETVLGYKVPEQARQLVNSSTQIGDLGDQTTSGLKHIAEAFK